MKLRALVVDDSRVMRSMVMKSLSSTNLAEFEFTEAEDGADALTKFDTSKVDIAFVDWNMPNMTGIDFVKKVRSMGNTGHIPMVMVTSEKTMGKIKEALETAGANAFICKPFTPEELGQKLKKVIDGMGADKKKSSGGFFSKLLG